MYLRYRESAWEVGEVAEAPPALHGELNVDPVLSQPQGNRAEKPSDRPPQNQIPTIELRSLRLHAITERQCIKHILDELEARRGGVVVTPNLDHLRRYLMDVNFRVLVAEADLVVADGMPLVWASRLQRTSLPERVAGSNLVSTLSADAGLRGRSVFLLGGSGDTAQKAAGELERRYPSLKVAGSMAPRMGFEKDTAQMAAIIAALSTAKPDIIYVGLGSPKQEQLIARLRMILPQSWWLGVGNSFSFLCGDVKRAPLWMQERGFEWVHRLYQEPRRLFTRYVTWGIPAAISLLAHSAGRGVINTLSPRMRIARSTTVSETPAPIKLTAKLEKHLTRVAWPMSAAEPERTDDAAPLSRLKAVILLGGSVRTSALSSATGRSVLDLPLDEQGSILNFWLGQVADTAKIANLDRLPVRVTVDQHSPEPHVVDPRFHGAFRVERDLSEYRGTGGILRDIADNYADDDLILVANAAQILLDPLPVIVNTLLRKRGDVALISHDDGTPSGIMLFSCKTLRLLPQTGFIDMKEQGLPLIAGKFEVRVIRRRRPTGLPVRSLEGYIQALHFYHRRRKGKAVITDPLAEDWTPSFSLVESGATVDASAQIHDSVVLAGGCVEPGAVLVRSVVCPGVIVRRDRTEVDQIVCAERPPRKRRVAV